MFLFQALAALSLNLAAAQQPLPVLKNSVQDSDEAPMMALSCGPIGELAQGVQSSALVNLMAASLENKLPHTSSGQQAKEWIRLLRAGGLDSLGLDEDGSVLIEVWTGLGENIRGSVPLRGSAEQTQELMERIFTQSLVQTDTGWLVMPKNPAGEPWRVETHTNAGQQNLVFTLGKPQANAFNAESMLQDLPNRTGCYVLASPQKGLVSTPFSSVFLTVNNDPKHPILVRVQTSINGLKSLSGGHQTSSQGSTVDPPVAVVELGIDLFEILQVPQVRSRLPDDFQTSLTKIQSRVQLPPGLTIAAFGTKDNPDLMVVLPILNARGKSIRPTRLTRLISRNLGSEERTVTRTAKDGFILKSNNRTVFGRVVAGKIVLGENSERVDEVASGQGVPWLNSEDQEWNADWPVRMKFRTPAGIPMVAEGMEGRAGLQLKNGRFEVAMQPSSTLTEALPSLLSQAVKAVPNLMQLQAKSNVEEVPAHLKGIQQAIQEQQAKGLTIDALPVAPRAVEELDKVAILWNAGPEWEPLQWEPEGSVRGVYWVSTSETGVLEIHGASDLDADGNPALWVLPITEKEPIRLTPEDVY